MASQNLFIPVLLPYASLWHMNIPMHTLWYWSYPLSTLYLMTTIHVYWLPFILLRRPMLHPLPSLLLSRIQPLQFLFLIFPKPFPCSGRLHPFKCVSSIWKVSFFLSSQTFMFFFFLPLFNHSIHIPVCNPIELLLLPFLGNNVDSPLLTTTSCSLSKEPVAAARASTVLISWGTHEQLAIKGSTKRVWAPDNEVCEKLVLDHYGISGGF